MSSTLLLLLPLATSFLISLLLLPGWIRRAHENELVGRDMNKYDKPLVAEGGGVVVVAGFVVGVLLYVALQTFYFHNESLTSLTFSLLTSILMIAIIGLVDTILGWKRGLSRRLRLVLVLFAAIPLVVVNAGDSLVHVPFMGQVNLGLLYPLLLIPLGVLGASTTFNFLAGYNGLEARQGILILGALALAAYFTGSTWLSIILLCMIASLLAFLFFNSYPATVFPGDVLTYSVGALIAATAILGNLERFALVIFIPNIIEVFLKARGRLKKESFAHPQKGNSLLPPHPRVYGLEHVALKLLVKFRGRAYEKDVVFLINLFQIVVIALAFIIFRQGIFYAQ